MKFLLTSFCKFSFWAEFTGCFSSYLKGETVNFICNDLNLSTSKLSAPVVKIVLFENFLSISVIGTISFVQSQVNR